jgi:hypothetical protein
MAVRFHLQRRLLVGADLLRQRASSAEAAARGRVDRARHVAGQDDALPLLARRRLGDGRQQRHRVRVLGVAVELCRGGQLDDLAQVHDGDPVADVADHRQVVSHKEVRQVELPLQLDQQVQHLGLDRNVERRDRLVGDDEFRLQDQGAGDADALALAAGELVRVAAAHLGSEADPLQDLANALVPRPVTSQLVDRQPLAHDLADGHARVQGSDRVLKDDLHVPAHRLHLATAQACYVAAFEADLA